MVPGEVQFGFVLVSLCFQHVTSTMAWKTPCWGRRVREETEAAGAQWAGRFFHCKGWNVLLLSCCIITITRRTQPLSQCFSSIPSSLLRPSHIHRAMLLPVFLRAIQSASLLSAYVTMIWSLPAIWRNNDVMVSTRSGRAGDWKTRPQTELTFPWIALLSHRYTANNQYSTATKKMDPQLSVRLGFHYHFL